MGTMWRWHPPLWVRMQTFRPGVSQLGPWGQGDPVSRELGETQGFGHLTTEELQRGCLPFGCQVCSAENKQDAQHSACRARPAPPVGRVSSQPAGPPPTSSSPAAPRRAPLSHSVNIYWASRLRARRLLPHHRTSKFPKVEPQRKAGVWPRGPCSGCRGGGGGVTATFIPIMQLKNEAQKSTKSVS